jgi:flagellar export protein FliJ
VKDLSTLIRLHKQELDERRVALRVLEDARSRLLARQRCLEEEFAAERKKAAASIEVRYALPAYTQAVATRRGEITRAKAELAKEIDRARAAVAEAFQRFKRYEITQTRWSLRAAAEERNREQKGLDDIAIDMFRRSQRT